MNEMNEMHGWEIKNVMYEMDAREINKVYVKIKT
jgi:hypothetical protein